MRSFLVASAAVALCSCSILDTDVQRGYELGPGWTTGSAFTTADVRMVTQRTHPLLGNQIVCTEPAPDVAKALSTAAALSAQGGNGVASGGFGASGSSAEALAELAGRSTALLGLRDGLYRACEAYANGVLGQDAYALVLTRYGQLMTTLFLGQDITGAAGAEGKAAIASDVLQAVFDQPASGDSKNGTTTTTTTKPASKTSGGTSDAGKTDPAAPAVVVAAVDASDKPRPQPAVYGAAGDGSTVPQSFQLAQAAKPKPAPAADPAPANNAAPSNTAGSNKQDPTTGSQPVAASAAGVSAAAALTLGRMNEDYFGLDNNPLHLLLVACISENDPTRLRHALVPGTLTPAPGSKDLSNPFLVTICDKLKVMQIADLQAAGAAAAASGPKPITPEAATMQLAAASTGKPNATTLPKGEAGPKPDPTILKVQYALKSKSCAGCDPGAADGILGPETMAAVANYQRSAGLPVNGNPEDHDLLTNLGIAQPAAPAHPAPAAAVADPGMAKAS